MRIRSGLHWRERYQAPLETGKAVPSPDGVLRVWNGVKKKFRRFYRMEKRGIRWPAFYMKAK